MSRTTPVTLTTMCMLRDKEGRVLVLNRCDPQWGGLTFPGGHVELDESFTDAAIREMREETGLTVLHPRLVGVKDWCNGDGSRYMVLLYTASEYVGTLHASNEGNVSWMTLDEMRSSALASSMEGTLRVFLDDALNEQWWQGDNEVFL